MRDLRKTNKDYIGDDFSRHEAAHALMAFREKYPVSEVNVNELYKKYYSLIAVPEGKKYISEFVSLAGLASYDLYWSRSWSISNFIDFIKRDPILVLNRLDLEVVGILQSEHDIQQFAKLCNLKSETYMSILLCIAPIWNENKDLVKSNRLDSWREYLRKLKSDYEDKLQPKLKEAIDYFAISRSYDSSTWDFAISVLEVKDTIRMKLKEPKNRNAFNELNRIISEKKRVLQNDIKEEILGADQAFDFREFLHKFSVYLRDFCYLFGNFCYSLMEAIFRTLGGLAGVSIGSWPRPKVPGSRELNAPSIKTREESLQKEMEIHQREIESKRQQEYQKQEVRTKSDITTNAPQLGEQEELRIKMDLCLKRLELNKHDQKARQEMLNLLKLAGRDTALYTKYHRKLSSIIFS